MQPGTIVLTRFPFTDLSSTKRRPALVLIQTDYEEPDTIVAFISSVVPAVLGLSDLLLDSRHPTFSDFGLNRPSVVMLEKLVTLQKSIFTGELGRLSENLFVEVRKKLTIALQLEKREKDQL